MLSKYILTPVSTLVQVMTITPVSMFLESVTTLNTPTVIFGSPTMSIIRSIALEDEKSSWVLGTMILLFLYIFTYVSVFIDTYIII